VERKEKAYAFLQAGKEPLHAAVQKLLMEGAPAYSCINHCADVDVFDPQCSSRKEGRLSVHQSASKWRAQTTKRAICTSQKDDLSSTLELALRLFGSSRMTNAVQE